MVELVARQVCFRHPQVLPALPSSGPFRLRDGQAEAPAELLQVFACGEESVALAFARLGSPPLEGAACRGLARIADEELTHERLLRGLRFALPTPARDRELRRAMIHFYHGIAQGDVGRNLASITALDSALCMILSALLEPKRVLAHDPTVAAIFRRIHRDEVGHVRFSRCIAVELAGRNAISAVAERTRIGLVDVLRRRGAALERLGIDAEMLFARLGRVPRGLFP